ncbi:MAG: excinuclease ABC subunit A [Rhizobiaceae bacterium]|nr:excinuclease ABC subunit A [Rhizobiaceae bacterium]
MTLAAKVNLLKYGSISLIGFGLLNFLSLFSILEPVMAIFLDIAFWSQFGSPHQLEGEAARLWIGISGGLLIGWGATLLLIATQVYPNTPLLGRRIILTGIISWFVMDSAGSMVAGAPFNVVMNLSFLVLFVVPLVWPERHSTSTQQAV